MLERRRGVCQDFAHLRSAACGRWGWARYVSGYCAPTSTASPGWKEPTLRTPGSACSARQNGWVDFDPTNGCTVGDSHIVLGWGRDFHDVSPVKGVVLGGSGSLRRGG